MVRSQELPVPAGWPSNLQRTEIKRFSVNIDCSEIVHNQWAHCYSYQLN